MIYILTKVEKYKIKSGKWGGGATTYIRINNMVGRFLLTNLI